MTFLAILNIFTVIFESIIIFMLLDTYIDKKGKYNIRTYFCSVIILSVLINVSNTILNLGLLNLVFVISSASVIAYMYNKQIKMNIIFSTIAVLILTITEIIVVFLVSLLNGVSLKTAAEVEEYVMLGTILSKLFTFFIVKLLCLLHKKNSILTMKTSYWVLFLIIFINSVVTIFLIFRLQYNSHSIVLYNLSVICSLGLLYSTFFSLYLYERIAKQTELEHRQQIYVQQIKAQSKHLDEILITQKELKKLRHDLKNHSISIRAFFEKGDCEAGLEYVENINELIGSAQDNIESGNIALDAIINTKRNLAVNKGIEFITNIQIPENIFVDAIDLCIIFGNALDNSIEACEQIVNKDKKITVSIVYEDDSLLCKITNTVSKANNKFPHSLKKDKANHGFGIKNIESALSKYKNVCRFNQTDDEFMLSFVIFKN